MSGILQGIIVKKGTGQPTSASDVRFIKNSRGLVRPESRSAPRKTAFTLWLWWLQWNRAWLVTKVTVPRTRGVPWHVYPERLMFRIPIKRKHVFRRDSISSWGLIILWIWRTYLRKNSPMRDGSSSFNWESVTQIARTSSLPIRRGWGEVRLHP
jgi:hypothetical protein